MLHERGTANDLDDAHEAHNAVRVGQPERFTGNELNGLRSAPPNGDIRSVQMGSVQRVANGVQAPFQTWKMARCLGEDGASAPC